MVNCWIIIGKHKGEELYWTKNNNFSEIIRCRVFMTEKFALKQIEKAIKYIEDSDDILWGECRIVPYILTEKIGIKEFSREEKREAI